MPRKRDPQRTEIIKKAVSDMFIYDEKSGDVYYNPDMSVNIRLLSSRPPNVPVGKLQTYKTPNRIYSYRVVNVPLSHYDTDGYLTNTAGKIVMVRHIVWFLNTGVWPDGNVIHKDENPNNCRFENLVHIRPEYMHVYKRFVNSIDSKVIAAYVEKRSQKIVNRRGSFYVKVPSYDAIKRKYITKDVMVETTQEAYDIVYKARYERLIWVRDNRLGGVDTTFYDNGLDLPKTKPMRPSDDAPYKVEQVVTDDDGTETPFVASLLIGAVNFISNRRKH